MSQEGETISYPSIVLVLALSYFIYRYLISSSNSPPASRNGLRFTPAQVDQISQMYPQISRRDIMWDLQRNRGQVTATVERLLSGRNLDPAPPSFQPAMPDSQSSQSQPSTTAGSFVSKKPEPDLIQRYNLQSKIAVEEKGKQKEQENGWSNSKEARQETLKQRRDQMILEARRKMIEKDRLKAEQTPAN